MRGAWWPELSVLDARVLRATDPRYERTAARLAERAGCGEDVAKRCLRRLRAHALVVVDGRCPSGWLRTHAGDVTLEHHPDDA